MPEARANAEGLGQCIADGKGPPGMKEGDVGNKGISMFKKMLPYICPSNILGHPFRPRFAAWDTARLFKDDAACSHRYTLMCCT